MTSFLLRVVLSDTDIRKLSLQSKPSSCDELSSILKEKFDLEKEFVLMYNDKDFNALCTLNDIGDIDSLSTVTVAFIASASENLVAEQSFEAPGCSSGLRLTSGEWPSPFKLPSFDHDVELVLMRGNENYAECGRRLTLTKSLKGSVLQRLACCIYDIKAYPSEREFESVAEALVKKYPCLLEQGSHSGFDGWRNSIQYKMGNYRSELRKAGSHEVAVNGNRRSCYYPNLPTGNTKIKKPRRSESNYLPNQPVTETAESQQEAKNCLIEEFQKSTADTYLIRNLMARTFSVRRREIVTEFPMMAVLLQDWPALFTREEVSVSLFYEKSSFGEAWGRSAWLTLYAYPEGCWFKSRSQQRLPDRL